MGLAGFRKARHSAHLKLREVAELMDVDIRTVQKWESQENSPKVDDLPKLCKVLNCTNTELLNGPESKRIEVRVVMNWEPMKGGITAMDMKNGSDFTLCIGNGNMLGIIGSAPLEDESSIDNFLADAKAKLMKAVKFQKEE